METDKFISNEQLKKLVFELTKYPAFIQRLDEYDRDKLKSFIKNEILEKEKHNLLPSNPDLEVMKIKMLVIMAGPDVTYSIGQIITVKKNEGKRLIDARYAEKVEEIGLNTLKKANDIIFDFEKNRKQATIQTEKNTKTILTGFTSTLKPPQIETLFEQLKGSYIDKNTNPNHFKAIFKNETLPDNCKIKWLKSNVLLAYFIKKLFHSDNPFDLWVKAENIFAVKNLNKSECNNPNPKGYNEIDKILKNIYTPL